ncbi:2-oxo-4-hydroxy-4-carboxy-5-ureidoimidazoline decarboxylase [Actinokineospora sp. NPDC004072]
MSGFIARLNAADSVDAAAELMACCASRRWVAAVVAGRPYPDLAALRAESAAVIAELAWPDLLEAVAAHPRIGERAAGPGVEAGWSRQEQAAAADADGDLRARLLAGNAEYERRFGHVFLISATGLSAADVLAALRARMGNDADAEREVVRAQLREIADLRLRKAAGG